MFHILLICAFIYASFDIQNVWCDNAAMKVAYQWQQFDFQFENNEQRMAAIQARQFDARNIIPFGLEIYGSRAFVTLPRWKSGVPASLAYFNLTEKTMSPTLLPYPSWEAHNLLSAQDTELVSPFRVRADRCGRLWVLDSRIAGVLEDTKLYGAAQLLIYDLHNDNLLRRHIFPKQHMKENSFFASLVIDDTDCSNTYAYCGDLGSPGLVVYSWLSQDSWRVQHNFFHPDPLAGNFSINNIEFQWDDGIYGLSLSRTLSGKTLLYFHPLSSTMEFMIDTTILRNKQEATTGQIYHKFKILGSRGTNAQAGASVYDKTTDIIFYAMPNLNAVSCWQTMSNAYTFKPENIVYASAKELEFPSDVIVDANNHLWILSNRLQKFLYGELNATEINFRILMANVNEAIKHTACALKTSINTNNNNNNKNNKQMVNSDIAKSGCANTTSYHVLLLIIFALFKHAHNFF